MSLPIYQRVAVTDAGDVIPGAEYTVINENTGVAQPIYSDRNGTSLKSAPYFADSVGTIQFFIAQGTTFRVAASGGVGTYTDRYVYGVAEAVLVQPDGNVGIGMIPTKILDLQATDNLALRFYNGVSFKAGFEVATTAGDMISTSAVNDLSIRSQANLLFSAGGSSENMRIDSAGDVAIGTNNPESRLHVKARINSTSGGLRLESQDGTKYATIDMNNAGDLRFYDGGVHRMRIDSAGNLLVGTTSSSSNTSGIKLSPEGTASFVRSGVQPLLVNRLTSLGDIAVFQKNGSTVGSIGARSNYEAYISLGSSGLTASNTGTSSLLPTTGGSAIVDNVVDLGYSGGRFDDIYATNGTIQTSDRNEKQDILEITAAEYNVAKACKSLLRSFRWIDAVEKKGDDARIHFGIIAQDLQDAFTAEGLDAGRYAMFLSNTWWETQTEVPAVEAVEGVEFVQAIEASEALYSEDGELISEAVEAVEGVEGVEAVEAKDAYTRTDTFDTLAEAPAGATERTRMGVRYTELLAFIIAAL